MANSEQTDAVLRFQDFQVNLKTGELWKAGIRLKLQDQPFKVLTTLLQRPGQVVPREELHQLIWPQESFGDFDHAINLAVNKLRATLGDSADVPHLIETLPRRGYRFIAPVETLPAPKRNLVPPAIKRVVPRWVFGSFDAIQKHPWPVASMTIMLFAAVLVGYLARHPSGDPLGLPVTRAVIKLEPGHMLEGIRAQPPFGIGQPTETAMAISSDGRFLVYSAIRENPGPQDKSQLYLRRTDELEAKPIAGTEGGISPFLSPDDRWIGFWADHKLMKVSTEGGSPVALPATLSDRVQLCCAAGSWGPDNKIVFAHGVYARLSMISADGGSPEILTAPDKSKGEFSHRLPHWLPDGKGVLFTIMREWFDDHPRVAVLELKTRKWLVLLEDAADARYVSTGHLVFLRQGTLMCVPFNLERREIASQPVPAVGNVMQALNVGGGMNSGAGQFSVSNSGWLVYATGGINPQRHDSLVWVDMKGQATLITSFKAAFWAPRLSPDGQRVAYITFGKEWHAWIYDLSRGTARQLTREGKADFPVWTRDGKRLVFKGWEAGLEANLYWQPVDGSSAAERLTTSDNHQVPGSISPDGATVAFVERHPGDLWDIQLLDLKSRRVTSFLNSNTIQFYPEYSPDGHWMAYTSSESGRQEIYVRPFPGPGGEVQVSSEGGREPLWSRNGKQLFYVGGAKEDEYWVADVRTDGSFSSSTPRLLFKSDQFPRASPTRTWDISLDGQRFLMVKFGEQKTQPVTELILVQNWFEELKRLAPTGKE